MKKTHRAMTARYVLSLGLLAVIVGISHMLFRRQIGRQQEEAAIINVAGRQRMLSQHILMHALLLVDPPYAADKGVNRQGLIDAVALMESSHEMLTRGVYASGMHRLSPRMQALYFESPTRLDSRVRTYLEHAKALAASPTAASASAQEHLKALVAAAPMDLLQVLDQAVTQLQSESEGGIGEISVLQDFALVAFMGALLLMGSTVLRPMVRRVVGEQEELRALNETLERRVVERSEQLARVRDQFIHNVNHELRTPITCVNTALKMLAEELGGSATEGQNECLAIAQRNVKQLMAMIEDLLEATRVQTGKLAIRPRAMALDESVRQAAQSMGLIAAKKPLDLRVDLPEGLPDVFADPLRVRQILVNLIGNAIKFTPEDGEIVVAARVSADDPEFVSVSVADTGPGISPEDAPKLFERLSQLHDAQVQHGLGLGLYICKELTVRQGGRIWVENNPGGGSRFVFTLPVASASEQAAVPQAPVV